MELSYISCFSLGADSLFPPPLSAADMTKVRNFVAWLARSGKRAAEIETTVDAAYGPKALGLT
jgi:hypothetical protein